MIDQHYLSAFVECILSLTMTAFGILNLLIAWLDKFDGHL